MPSRLPLCLPQFNSTSTLFAYSNFFCREPDFSFLVLTANNDADEQFRYFRKAFSMIKEYFGFEDDFRYDITDISPTSLPSKVLNLTMAVQDSRYRGYCMASKCIHFLYRKDGMSGNSSRSSIPFAQCITLKRVGFPFKKQPEVVWRIYQKLSVMLRGVSPNSILRSKIKKESEFEFTAQQFFFDHADTGNTGDNLVCMSGEYETFIALSGADFELYCCFSGNIGFGEAEKNCKILLEHLRKDSAIFISRECNSWDK